MCVLTTDISGNSHSLGDDVMVAHTIDDTGHKHTERIRWGGSGDIVDGKDDSFPVDKNGNDLLPRKVSLSGNTSICLVLVQNKSAFFISQDYRAS